ncbi:MAG: hypothetical protein JW969_10795 [Spirochaetales bacterium]|nr:hypothetical protein [Spirochaetales bacterium]
MKVAIVFFPGKNRDKLINTCKGLSKGIESQGHQVTIIDGQRDVTTKLTGFQYIALGSECISLLGGRLPEGIIEYLSNAGLVSGKASFAFVLKTFFGSARALSRLMSRMEKEGMFVRFSEVFSGPEEAEAIGTRLHVEKA